MKTLEEYLREAIRAGSIDFELRASVAADGRLVFYVHPNSRDGETADFEVCGNALAHNRDVK